MNKSKHFVVTGGAGFIGSHLIELLIQHNFEVTCIDDLSTGKLSNIDYLDKINFIKNSVQNVSIGQLGKIDGIFHLAAQASVPVSIEEFYFSSSNNLQSTLKVWDWAKNINIPVVYASSSAIYGNLPIGDDKKFEFDILSPYAQDKLTMEHYAQMAWNIYETGSIGLRFFNVYGPRQDPSNPYSGVISIFLDRLLNNIPITVNGGFQTRDFIYVKDIVNVMFKSMIHLEEKKICESFNVGTGTSISVDRLLEILEEVTAKKVQVKKIALPQGDPEKSAGTYDKLKQILDMENGQFMSLRDGLDETVLNYMSNGKE